MVMGDLKLTFALMSGVHHIPAIKEQVRTVSRCVEMYVAGDFKVMFV